MFNLFNEFIFRGLHKSTLNSTITFKLHRHLSQRIFAKKNNSIFIYNTMRTIADNHNLLNSEGNLVLDIITTIKSVITLGHEVIAGEQRMLSIWTKYQNGTAAFLNRIPHLPSTASCLQQLIEATTQPHRGILAIIRTVPFRIQLSTPFRIN